QNAPVISFATSDRKSVTLQGTLGSEPNTTYRIELFSNGTGDPSGFGEGQSTIGSTTLTTNATGFGTFSFTYSLGDGVGAVCSATATKLVGGVPQDTSEFSANAVVVCGPDLAGPTVSAPNVVTVVQTTCG